MHWFGPVLAIGCGCAAVSLAAAGDHVRELQTAAITARKADWGHWGAVPTNYVAWGSHSNRLVPVYTFGTKTSPPGGRLSDYQGVHSPYRDAAAVVKLYGREPTGTVNPSAEYFDQTNLYDLQKAALAAGKKHIFLVVFDGMDWQTTWAAAIVRQQKVPYTEGRGTGLQILDYTANGTTEFGYCVTSPHNDGTKSDVDRQTVTNPGGKLLGGFNSQLAGDTPWAIGSDLLYPIAQSADVSLRQAYTDSSSSATSMTAGIKTFNDGVNIDFQGVPVSTIAHEAQAMGYAIGAVSSVPISHATPAAAYAVNVSRDDYQDLTRDMVGLPSISHPTQPLAGMDVVIGGGFGNDRDKDQGQGANFVPGNAWITAADLQAIDVSTGGKYVTAVRAAGVNGRERLHAAAKMARQQQQRLFGFYGNGKFGGHLPFQTADGDFKPTVGRTDKSEDYTAADLDENPTLADMTTAALAVLSVKDRFWLMVEPGDVDWANHDNNIDNSIGAVLSGDDAVKAITDWVDQHSNWNDALLIVTADHGHYLNLTRPEALISPPATR
jgi:alkaline phosphatase